MTKPKYVGDTAPGAQEGDVDTAQEGQGFDLRSESSQAWIRNEIFD